MTKQRACTVFAEGQYTEERVPITITDPTQGRWKSGIVTYKLINDTGDIEGTKLESRSVNLAFLEWGRYIKDIRFKRLVGNVTADIVIKFDGKDPYFGSDNILAYAWYPNVSDNRAGDIVFNDSPTLRWSLTGKPIPAHIADPIHYPDPNDPTMFKTTNQRQVMTHELGHALGFTHNTACKECMMYPYYHNDIFLAENDIERAQYVYGKRLLNASYLESLRTIIGRPIVS